MELLDRYLQAVKFWLPKEQQDDIVAELSEDIRSQIEEQEGELGRKLNSAEMASILKRHGRPLLVANRYLPQQFLIGPVLFPIYKLVLKIVILCYLIPWLLVWVGLMSFDPAYRATHSVSDDLISSWGSVWITSFMAIGIVTAVFAVLERAQTKPAFLENWDPVKLPAVRDVRQIPRFSSVMGVAANVLFLAWWVKGKWSLTVFDQSGVRIVVAPIWQSFFWAILVLCLAVIVLFSVNLVRPQWTRLRAGIQLALDCTGSAVFCWVLKAHILAEISAPNLSAGRAAEIVDAINTNMARSFPFAVAACVLIVALADVGRLYRIRATRAPLAQGLAVIALLAVAVAAAGSCTLR